MFMKAAEAVQVIHSYFNWQFQEGTLKEHGKNMGDSKNFDQINMWNRYFTPAYKAKEMQVIAFLPGVNPVGTLHGMSQEDTTWMYIHTEDNQVHFYTTHRDNAGNIG